MDEFTPGQGERIQSAWELYRHKLTGDSIAQDSFVWSVGDDGYTCVEGVPATSEPSTKPNSSQTQKPTISPRPTLTAQPTDAPTKPATDSPTMDFAEVGWNFDTGLDGWLVTSGSFIPDNQNQGQTALKSSSNLNDICDRIQSPTVRLTSSSTLSMRTHFDIETKSKGT